MQKLDQFHVDNLRLRLKLSAEFLIIIFLIICDFLKLSAPLAFISEFNDNSITKERSIVLKVELVSVAADSEVTFFSHVLTFEEFALADLFGVSFSVEVVGMDLLWEGRDLFGGGWIGEILETDKIKQVWVLGLEETYQW